MKERKKKQNGKKRKKENETDFKALLLDFALGSLPPMATNGGGLLHIQEVANGELNLVIHSSRNFNLYSEPNSDSI